MHRRSIIGRGPAEKGIGKLFITVYTVHIGYKQLRTGGVNENSAKLRDSDL